MSFWDDIDVSKYESHVQLALKFAKDMEGHKPGDCALAAVKVLAFCAWVGSDDPQVVLEATKVMFNAEIRRLKDSGIKQRGQRPDQQNPTTHH